MERQTVVGKMKCKVFLKSWLLPYFPEHASLPSFTLPSTPTEKDSKHDTIMNRADIISFSSFRKCKLLSANLQETVFFASQILGRKERETARLAMEPERQGAEDGMATLGRVRGRGPQAKRSGKDSPEGAYQPRPPARRRQPVARYDLRKNGMGRNRSSAGAGASGHKKTAPESGAVCGFLGRGPGREASSPTKWGGASPRVAMPSDVRGHHHDGRHGVRHGHHHGHLHDDRRREQRWKRNRHSD